MKKMKILVPTDFSETAFAAFEYAAHLSLKLDAEITLMHVINDAFYDNEAYPFTAIAELTDTYKKKLKYFAEEYPVELEHSFPKIEITYELRFGLPGFSIADFAKDFDFDLIVMGTRDRHGIIDKLLGTTSSTTMKMAHCPTLLIHRNTKFTDPQKIVFAFDEKADIEDALEDFDRINTLLKCHTDFVHVQQNGADLLESKKEIIEELFEHHNSTYFFNIKSIKGDSVRDALMDYTKEENADILALVHRQGGIFRFLFGSSLSIQVARQFHLPVLVLPN